MKEQETTIIIPCAKTFEFVLLKRIIRFEGLQNYTKVFMSDGSILLSNINIGQYKKELSESGFFCCHKSHLINLNHIIRYYKSGYVEMADYISIPVSRRRKEVFLKQILLAENLSLAKRVVAKSA